jgi:cytochrome P450
MQSLYFEPFDLSCRPGLFETYGRLHREAPVRQCESGFWSVVRADDLRSMYTRQDLFSNRPNGAETINPPVDFEIPEVAERLMPVFDSMLLDSQEVLSAPVIVGADPPIHTRIRSSVNRAFTRNRIQSLRGYIEQEVASCLAGIDEAEVFDVNDDLATPIPLRVMTRLFGLDPADDVKFRDWAYRLASQLNAENSRGSAVWLETHYKLISEFADYFVPLIQERTANPGADLLSDIAAEESDALNASETVLFILTLLGAGIETTSNLIGNVVVELLRHEDQLEMVLNDPSLVSAAIEESLRFDSPFQFTFRQAKADVELSGVRIPSGSLILNMVGAANRDPAHFVDPDRFDINRTGAHLGFGQGIHFCLGAALARMEAEAAISGLLPHLRDFALDEDGIVDRASILIWGREKVPLVRRSSA